MLTVTFSITSQSADGDNMGHFKISCRALIIILWVICADSRAVISGHYLSGLVGQLGQNQSITPNVIIYMINMIFKCCIYIFFF